jgi:Protein of unknown function (DUF3105)
MSSRKEEKERLRREREELERAATASENRRKRIGIALGGLLAAAVAVIVVLAVLSGGDDNGGSEPGGGDSNGASLPTQQTDDLDEAVKAASCTFKEFPDEGNSHLPSREDTFDGYKTNPPTSGTHVPPPAALDGVYEPGNSPPKEHWVHTLEHGRVIFQYKPGTPANRIDQLETLMNEGVNGQPGGYKSALMENNTEMPFAVAAVSWRSYVACEQFTDRAFDALRAFRAESVDNGVAPEGDFPWPFTGT